MTSYPVSRMDRLRLQLARLPGKSRRIIYLVTEDRDFLEELFTAQADLLKTFSEPAFADQTCLEPEYMYRACLAGGYLADLYEMQDARTGRMEFRNCCTAPGKLTPFYFLTDFQVLPAQKQAELFLQFLHLSRKREAQGQPVYLFLISPFYSIPQGFDPEVELIDVPEMDEEDIFALLVQQAQHSRPAPPDEAETARIRQAAQDMKGLSRRDILELARQMSGKGSFYGATDQTMEKIESITAQRRRLVQQKKLQNAAKDNTLSMLEPRDALAGMTHFVAWLNRVRHDLRQPQRAEEWGAGAPRGVVLTGLPGCGKTAAARKAAYEMGVSLVELRMDNLLGGRVGDSEARFKRYRKQVEALAPCVVLIDEIEKTFDKRTSDPNGVRQNLLFALLDWLQNHEKPIFFFATSNDIEKVPPELVRVGRFDETFCVFLPPRAELEEILSFHLRDADRRSGGQLMQQFSARLPQLASAYMDYVTERVAAGRDLFHTGSTIEGLVRATGVYLRTQYENASPEQRPYYRQPGFETYLEAMKAVTASGAARAYGESNMGNIVRFWLGALERGDASASEMLLPFAAFDRERGVFRTAESVRKAAVPPPCLPGCDGYDRLLQQRLCKEIEAAWKAARRGR